MKISWVIALTFVAVTWVNFNQERWLAKNVIVSDVAHYHSYLPAFFYGHDLGLGFLSDSVNGDIESRYYAPNHTPSDKPVIKMTMGMAISYLPFFALAHVYANLFDFAVDGFSTPYHFAVLFSSLFYYLIGLFFLGRILSRYFDMPIVSLTLFCITFGTNVFYYLTVGGGMPHPVNFAFAAVFIYYTILWHEDLRVRSAILIGLAGGFLVLLRPVNILLVIFFLLYGIWSYDGLKEKLRLLLSQKINVLIMLVCGFLIFLPQLIYWKYVTGEYLFNSYVGERFYFDRPHILKALLGFRKGWLIYTPMMIFSLIGVFMLRRSYKQFFLPVCVTLIIYLYVVFSWWCWWYGGSFGQRVLIDIYPLLAIPFAALFVEIKKKQVLRRICYLAVTFFVFLNLFQTMQSKYNILHFDSMTWENYREIFFTATTKPDREKHLRHPDYEKALRGEDED